MVRLIKVAFQKDMIKVDDNGRQVWYECDKAVKGFIKSNFKEAICNKENVVLEAGEEIVLTTEDRGGKQFAIRASKPGQAAYNPPPASTQSAPSAAPASNANAKPAYYGQKSPEESEKITRLSVLSSAVQAAQVITGSIQDPSVVGDVVLSLYDRFLLKIKS